MTASRGLRKVSPPNPANANGGRRMKGYRVESIVIVRHRPLRDEAWRREQLADQKAYWRQAS